MQPRRTHQPRYALAPDADLIRIGQLRVDVRCPVRLAREPVDRANLRRQGDIRAGPAPTSAGSAARSSRSWKCPAAGTFARPTGWPGSPSRIRRALRLRGLLVRKPGRGSCQDLWPFLQLPIFTAQPRELLALRARQSAITSARIPRGLLHPLADRPAVQPNSFANSSNERPARCSSPICRRNSGVYRLRNLDTTN